LRAIEPVEIELGGRKRSLLFSHRILRRAEVELNRARKSRPDELIAIETAINRAVLHGFPHDLTEILLWSGLVDDDPALTVESVSDMISDRLTVVTKLIQAINASYPRPAAAQEVSPSSPLSNGSTSGPSDGFN